MDLKKLLGVCLAVLLVAGFSAPADAAVATPTGVTIRVATPDSGQWAAIGDSIIVNVYNNKGLGGRLDGIVLGVFDVDTTVAAITANTDIATVLATDFANALLSGSASAPTDSTGGILRYRFAFAVTAGIGTTIDGSGFPDLDAGIIRIAVDTNTTANENWLRLNNRSVDTNTPISTLAERVGDGKRFGVDGERPVTGSFITSVLVDTTALFAAHDTGFPFPAGVQASAKNGSSVKINLNVASGIANAADSGVVMLLPYLEANPDSAVYRHTFDIVTLVNAASAGNAASTTFTVASGASGAQTRQFRNNERIAANAFLVDQAGNLSGTAANSAAIAFSSGQVVVIDSKVPSITVTHPKNVDNPDSNRFTIADKDSTNIVSSANGTLTNTLFNLQPVRFAVNEPTLTRIATFGGDSATFGATTATSTQTVRVDTNTVSNYAGFKRKGADKTADSLGVSGSLVVIATDSVGNTGSTTVASVIFDPGALPLNSIFPATASGVDTINQQTDDPVINLDEAADSISIRYVEVGNSSPHVVTQTVGASSLTQVDTDVTVPINADTLRDNLTYTLQVLFFDLARNLSASTPDTLVFDKEFVNPIADSFIVALAGNDSVLVGSNLSLTVTAIDSQLTRQFGSTKAAVTYEGDNVVLRVNSGSQDISKLTISGTGVTDNGDGTATLSAGGWVIGKRTVTLKSELVLDSITVTVEDTSIAVVSGENVVSVDFNGNSTNLFFDNTEFTAYAVTAWEDGVKTSSVSQDFGLNIVPVDRYGNPSIKGSATLDKTSHTKHDQMFVEVSAASASGTAQVPTGPISVGASGRTVTAVAPNGTGDDLVINVRTANTTGDSTSGDNQAKAQGSVTLSFVPWGEAPPTDGVLAAPDTVIVQDWLGANGQGDQGGFIFVSFPAVDANVSQYRVYREVTTTVGFENGVFGPLSTPASTWIPWTAIDAVSGVSVVQAVVPTLDGAETRWAVASESGRNTSEQQVAGKRVFTKELVQNLVQYLGVDPNRVLSNTELEKVFSPSADYVKSIIGDREGVTFAALDPNFDSLLGESNVPGNIRTQTTGIRTSEMFITAPFKAIDNIPPAAVTGAQGGNTGSLAWTPSTDDRTVGYMQYRGFAVPIAGVDHYEVWRGETTSTLEMIASVPAGSGTYMDTTIPTTGNVVYRIDAVDLDNSAMGTPFQVNLGQREFLDANGRRIYIIKTLNASTPYINDFEDFIEFAGSYGSTEGSSNYNIQADTNLDGEVNFPDFVSYAGTFGFEAVAPAGKAATKPVIQVPGVNDNVSLSLALGSDRVLVGETVTVNVNLDQASSLQGYGFNFSYDTDKFEFVKAAPAEEDLLKIGGAETPLFLSQDNNGEIAIANAVINGSPVSGSGTVVSLTFRVLREFEDEAQFQIADGVVFDGAQLRNPAVSQGSLSVQSTPTEFALLQNFPNPFNPETTIKYNLAETANVHLRIYNVVGQVVRTLVAEQQSAGRYTIRWNGTDDRGLSVSSGIYFYQLSAAGQFNDVRKLMLLK